MRNRRRQILEIILLFSLLCSVTQAQVELNIQRVSVSWPQVTMFLKGSCLGSPITDLRKEQLRIWENDIELSDFTVICPPPGPQAFSVALVLDASGSMRGEGIATLKEAALNFIGNMDGAADEAAVVFANEHTAVQQTMTSNRPILESALQALFASGSSGGYDALYEGIMQVINGGANASHGVVGFFDSDNAVSTRDADEVIAMARRYRVPIHIIGYGGDATFTEFALVAAETGGYFTRVANRADATAAFMEVFRRLRLGEEYCRVMFDADCPDGTRRDLRVMLHSSCGGTAIEQIEYSTPVDSTAFTSLPIGFPNSTLLSNTVTELPLLVHAPPQGAWLQPFTLRFRSWTLDCYQVFGVGDLAGTVLADRWSYSRYPDTIEVRSTEPVFVRGTQTLMRFDIVVPQITGESDCTLPLFDIRMEKGCLIPELQAATIHVTQSAPFVRGITVSRPVVTWDASVERFTPEEFELRYRLKNFGSTAAEIVGVRLLDYADAVTLLQPTVDQQLPSTTILPPQDSIEVAWMVRPLRRPMKAIEIIPIEVTFSNHPPVFCNAEVDLGSALPLLQIWLDAPRVEADSVNGRYDPMPIPLTVRVKNEGGHPSGAIDVVLGLGGQMTLAPPATPFDQRKALTPAVLAPGESGTVSWDLVHPHILETRDVPISARAISLKGDSAFVNSSFVTAAIRIPRLDSRDSVAIPGFGYTGYLCPNDSMTLDAEEGFAAYIWSTGARTRSIVVKDTGEYQVRAVNARGDTLSSRVFTIHARPVRAVSIEATPPAACEGDTIWLRVAEEFAEYHWSDQRSGRLVPVTSAQPLRVTGTDEFGCTYTSEQYIATFHPRPVKPEIARIADTLLVQTPAARFLWYRDGVLVQDDTQPQFTVEQPGVYHVEAVSTEGCVAVSDPFAVTTVAITAVASPEGLRLEVYPDPASTRVYVTCATVDASPVEVRLHDMLGRSLDAIRGVASGQRVSFDVSSLPRGSYLITLHTAQGIVARRVGKL